MKKTFVLLIALVLSGNIIYSQAVVKPGKKIPDLEFKDVINYKSKNLKLSELNKKLIILDFWGTTCLPCLEALPGLEELQKQFNDKIQVILVNQQSNDSTLRFFAARKRIRMPDLPLIRGDTLVNKIFPHSLMPFG